MGGAPRRQRRIDQIIYVRRSGQRAIVLGDKGTRIKAIGARARGELERLLDRRVHLFLFVKVRENWIEDPERFAALGLDYNVLAGAAASRRCNGLIPASCSGPGGMAKAR